MTRNLFLKLFSGSALSVWFGNHFSKSTTTITNTTSQWPTIKSMKILSMEGTSGHFTQGKNVMNIQFDVEKQIIFDASKIKPAQGQWFKYRIDQAEMIQELGNFDVKIFKDLSITVYKYIYGNNPKNMYAPLAVYTQILYFE